MKATLIRYALALGVVFAILFLLSTSANTMTTDSKVRRVVSVQFEGGPLDGQTKRIETSNPHMAPSYHTIEANRGIYTRVGMSKNMEWVEAEVSTVRPKVKLKSLSQSRR